MANNIVTKMAALSTPSALANVAKEKEENNSLHQAYLATIRRNDSTGEKYYTYYLFPSSFDERDQEKFNRYKDLAKRYMDWRKNELEKDGEVGESLFHFGKIGADEDYGYEYNGETEYFRLECIYIVRCMLALIKSKGKLLDGSDYDEGFEECKTEIIGVMSIFDAS